MTILREHVNESGLLVAQIGTQYMLPVVHEQVRGPKPPRMNPDAVHVSIFRLVPDKIVVFPVLYNN